MGATQGTEASGNGRTRVVACGALARELLHVVEANGLDRIDVECLPASYHNEPDRIPPAVADRVRAAVERYDRIFVGYADCGTGGRLDAGRSHIGGLEDAGSTNLVDWTDMNLDWLLDAIKWGRELWACSEWTPAERLGATGILSPGSSSVGRRHIGGQGIGQWLNW